MHGEPFTVASTGRGRRLAVVLVALSLVITAAPVGVSAGATPADAEPQTSFLLDKHTLTNNTTRHEHPDRVSGSQDLVSARRWLAGRMGTQLERCVVEVGFGTTNVCEFDDQYPSWLSKYVDIAEETDDEDDDRWGSTFDETKENHETYSRAVSNFTRTYEAYQAAKAAGDDERARALARELQRDGDAVTANGSEILRDYRDIQGEAGVSLDAGKTSVNATLANVTETVETVEEAEFIPTVLQAAITPREISFLEPGMVTGRLTTENGTGIANRAIDLRIGDRELRTRTDESDRFTVEYRPTTIPLSTDRLVVSYLPPDESVYLASRTTIPVSIVQVEPTVSVSLDAKRAAFGDEVQVTGVVSADGIAAQNVPVRVVIDGRSVGTIRTDETGAFSTSSTIHASDGPGEIAVRAVVALEDRALASAGDSAPLSIEKTSTALDLDPIATSSRTVTASGRLTTRDGAPVANQPVTLLVNGTAVESVRTADDGTYRTGLSVPASVLADEENTTINLVARFDGSGTNLDQSTARTVLTLPHPSQDRPDGTISGVIGSTVSSVRSAIQDAIKSVTRSPVLWGLGVLGIGLGLVFLYFRDRLVSAWTGRPRGQSQSSETDTTPESPTEPEPDATTSSPFAAARTRLATEPDTAVMLAYATVRDRLAKPRRSRRRSAETHWEFLAACRQDGLDAEAIEGLTGLTEAYEKAAFAPASVERSEAETALAAAERLL